MAKRESSICVIKLGKENIKFAWYVDKQKNPYKEIAGAVGAQVNVGASTSGLVFGASKPRPMRLRFNLQTGGSRILFCDPGKAESVVSQNTCKGKKINGVAIVSAGYIGK